jgi:hypothetical protein
MRAPLSKSLIFWSEPTQTPSTRLVGSRSCAAFFDHTGHGIRNLVGRSDRGLLIHDEDRIVARSASNTSSAAA